jgi:P27 family predicted phage terminase small subunit
MARPGRAPKPSGLRLIEGTDRRGRTGRTLDRSKEPVPPGDALEPPYEMTEDVARIWEKTTSDLDRMGLGDNCDAYQVAGYCEAAALFERASRELDAPGVELVIEGAASPVANKLIGIRAQAATQMLRFAQEFGLTPAARVRVETNGSHGGAANPFA